MNIIDLVKSQVAGDAIKKLSSVIGESPAKTESALGAALPALLAGLANLASKPEGNTQLNALLAKQDTSVLGNFNNLLGSQGGSLAEKGVGTLSSLLGGDTLNGLLGALGKFTGLRQNSTSSLLGTLTPLVLGVLGKQKTNLGLDANGLASMLAGQKQNIMGAMPAGLGDALSALPGMGGLFDSAKSALGGAANAARQGAGEVAGAAGRAADAARAGATQAAQQAGAAAAKTGSSVASWLIPLVIVVGAIILFSQSKGCRQAAPTPTDVSAEASTLAGSFKGMAETATVTLASIKDAASADLALPKLREISASLDGLKVAWDKIPATARGPIATAAGSLRSTLTAALEKLNQIPDVGPKVKPVIDELVAKLAAFAA